LPVTATPFQSFLIFFNLNYDSPNLILTQNFFLRGLGLVYFLAFASLGFQITGLIGNQGILPAKDFLDWAGHQFQTEKYIIVPSIFWIKSGNLFIQTICGAGALSGLLMLAGKFRVLPTSLCWLFYLSIASVGREFLWYQWDTLLLEVGFLSIFLCPWGWRGKSTEVPSTFLIWLFRFLAFKLEFSSGVVKLASGDSSWRDLSALNYHYETQPIPTLGGWFFHQLPHSFHEVSTAFILCSQLICPFLIFTTRQCRIAYFFLMVSTQCFIAI
jgi:lipase maturation factor 1